MENLTKAYGDKLAGRRPVFCAASGAVSSGVNSSHGAGKITLFSHADGQEQPDSGTIEYGDTSSLSMSISPAPRSVAKSTVGKISDGGEIIQLGAMQTEMNSRALTARR